jgi:hypothetical protein
MEPAVLVLDLSMTTTSRSRELDVSDCVFVSLVCCVSMAIHLQLKRVKKSMSKRLEFQFQRVNRRTWYL